MRRMLRAGGACGVFLIENPPRASDVFPPPYEAPAPGLSASFSLSSPAPPIAGYYDAAPEKIRPWLEAAKPYPKMSGVMYTTWVRNYRGLEKFADEARAGAKEGAQAGISARVFA